MNSNSKYWEEGPSELEDKKPAADPQQVFKAKIQYQIKGYLYRKLSAENEIADLTRCVNYDLQDYENIYKWRARIAILMEEIKFCKEQVYAYENNDNKAKIIPDRCI